MVFSSGIFIFVFLPVVLLVYFLMPLFKSKHCVKIQHSFLTIASLIFYGYFKIEYVFIIISSILINYALAFLCQKSKASSKHRNPGSAYFIVGVLFNILLLGYFKYFDFLRETINQIAGTSFSYMNILLPLGISFFTFQQILFIMSINDGSEKVSNFIDYTLFVTFFPQLIAGPIVSYGNMIPQFLDHRRSRFNPDNFSRGLYTFVIGLFKKSVIADSVALFADNAFGLGSYGFLAAWAAMIAYTLQIYFDFSGYSDMAVGLGKMFNIDLPVNFDSPYKSTSIREFWRRWHITLGTSLSQFVYIPLGGNRKGEARACFNLMVTFFISGLWHGAAWTFVVWGLLHGAVMVLERIFKGAIAKLPNAIKGFFTFLFAGSVWVLFRADSFAKALSIFKGMISFGNMRISQISTIVYDGIFTFPLAVNILTLTLTFAVLLFIVFRTKNTIEMSKTFVANRGTVLFSAVLFMISAVFLSRQSTFIYFNF